MINIFNPMDNVIEILTQIEMKDPKILFQDSYKKYYGDQLCLARMCANEKDDAICDSLGNSKVFYYRHNGEILCSKFYAEDWQIERAKKFGMSIF